MAVALLRRVAAHEAKACREWGHPKEGKWQKDEDCCAGSEQAACAAGHRYVKGDVCHKEVECKAFSYECELCQPGEACDTNYDVATEKGEDYDCKQNLWSGCYFLWPIAWIFFYLAIRRVNKLIEEGKQSEAKYVWIKTKWGAVWKSTSVSGAPGNSSLSHFSAMARPCWLGRAARNRHRHAIEQASRRWRGGQRDELRRKI